MKYKVMFDAGKPYEESFDTDEEMQDALKKFYINNKAQGNDAFNVTVFNKKDEDIGESQFMQEMFAEILEEVEC